MARNRRDTFEDRGQSQRPPKAGAGARNQGGFYNSPIPNRGKVAPPPVSRARKDSVLRPVNDGGSSSGGGVRSKMDAAEGRGTRKAPVAPPARRDGRPQMEKDGAEVGIGPSRKQEAAQTRSFRTGTTPGPPIPRSRDGSPTLVAGEMAQEAAAMEKMAPTPGSVRPEDAQEQKNLAEMPPSSPANAGARTPQGPEELGQPMAESGAPLATPDAEPPQNDPSVAQGMTSPEESADEFNDAVGEAGPDSFGGRMGEQLLGMKLDSSDQISNGKEWRGEIGPGMSSNEAGALGIPGQHNSPEDVAFNRQRFDQALEQSRGDKHAAALSSGAFPSGNPIAHGTMTHMKRLTDSMDGDGVDPGGMDESTRRRYKADAVRQTEEYGPYPGMDDPDSPAPPIRPLSWSFNPHTSKMVAPEGAESYIDRFGGGSL